MAVWLVVKKWLSSHLFKLSNRSLLIFSGLYVSLSWWLLVLAGETALTDSFANFIYYLMVTASTVGYGDHSPVTDLGKWVVVLFVIPGGLSLFAALLGRVAGAAMDYWRAGYFRKTESKSGKPYCIVGLEWIENDAPYSHVTT